MNKIKTLEKIFEDYKKNVFKLSNYENLKAISNIYSDNFRDELEIRVNLIDNLLKALPEEESEFLISYYVENKPKNEYYLSDSTFYCKLRKIANNFVGYLEANDSKSA